MIQILSILGIEGMFFNMIKGIYEKPTANVMNGEKVKTFLRSVTRQGCLLSPLLFSTVP